MPNYELVLIISPEVANEEVPAAVTRLGELVGKVGGSVADTTQWGRRKLSYPIKRFAEGNYVLAQLQLEPDSAKELESSLRMSGEIIRHLLVKVGE